MKGLDKMIRHRSTDKDHRNGAINCRVRPAQLEYIRTIARGRRISMSALAEEALLHYLKIDLKKWDAM